MRQGCVRRGKDQKKKKREKNYGEGRGFQQVVYVCQIIKLYTSTAPHQQQTLQLSLKHNKSIPSPSNNSSGLRLNRHYWQLKFANNSELHVDPIDHIKVNSQMSPIEASSPPMSNGHTTGTTGRLVFLIERLLTVARGEEGNDL